jgi:hypothetical protein
MESVLIPRVFYGAPVWATHQNKSKLQLLAAKVDNLTAIFTLGTFKSTPTAWHRARSAVQEAALTFSILRFKFFAQKLTIKHLNNHLKQIFYTRGFLTPKWAAPSGPTGPTQTATT